MVAPATAANQQQQQGCCQVGFFHKLQRRVAAVDSLLCVGLDPHAAELSLPPAAADPATAASVGAAAAYSFCERIIKESLPYVCCYKPNSAFFEAFGSAGIQALERLCKIIPSDIPIILDVKRGDIGSTAEAYASAAFSVLQVDAVTVSPYLGRDSLLPFLKYKNKGVFVLVKTSNASADELQALQVVGRSSSSGSGGSSSSEEQPRQQQQPEPLFLHVAALCNEMAAACVREEHSRGSCASAAAAAGEKTNFFAHNEQGGGVGLVAGALDTHALKTIRAACPDLWILSPGVGAQGADLQQALAAGLRHDGSGLIIPVSRGISRAKNVAAEAASLRDKINEARRLVCQGWSSTTGN